MSRWNDIKRCACPTPDAISRYSGEQCVLTKDHKSEHRSLSAGHDSAQTWPNEDPTLVMVKDVRRIIRRAGLPASKRATSSNWSWITRDGAQVDRWGNQIVRVLWLSDHAGRAATRQATGAGAAWKAAVKALRAAGYRVICTRDLLLASRRVLRKTVHGYE
jgi:hypothetical protein